MSELTDLLNEIRENEEIIIFGQAIPQYDAIEPRYRMTLSGPERLLKALITQLEGLDTPLIPLPETSS